MRRIQNVDRKIWKRKTSAGIPIIRSRFNGPRIGTQTCPPRNSTGLLWRPRCPPRNNNGRQSRAGEERSQFYVLFASAVPLTQCFRLHLNPSAFGVDMGIWQLCYFLPPVAGSCCYVTHRSGHGSLNRGWAIYVDGYEGNILRVWTGFICRTTGASGTNETSVSIKCREILRNWSILSCSTSLYWNLVRKYRGAVTIMLDVHCATQYGAWN
jgi:hypothetical protein